MTHYFKNSENLPHNRKEIAFRFLGVNYTFSVDDGVFSKSKPDDGSLLLVENILKQKIQGKVLDLGSGYGLISLLLKHQQADLKVTAYEVNERAVECAVRTAQRMKLDVDFRNQDVLLGIEGQYDVVVTNPPIRAGKQVVYAFFDFANKHLVKDGCLYVVIRRQQGAASAFKALQQRFETVERIDLHKGFEIIKACKPLTLE